MSLSTKCWERFKELLLLCAHRGQDKWVLLQTFYNALDNTTRLLIDASSGGTIMNMNVDDAWDKIEDIAQHTHYYNDVRSAPGPRKGGLYEVDSNVAQQAKMEALAQEIRQLKLKVNEPKGTPIASGSSQGVSAGVCQFCSASGHTISTCQLFNPQEESQEVVSYMNNFNKGQRYDPYSNTYNPDGGTIRTNNNLQLYFVQ